MKTNKQQKPTKTDVKGDQLAMDFNAKSESVATARSGAKVISISSLQESRYKEIIDLTIRTTKSF